MTQEEFLRTCKAGDKAIVRDRRMDTFGRTYGYRIYTLTNVPPKRSKFVAKAPDGQEVEFNKHGVVRIGGTWGESFYLEAFHEEALISIEEDDKRLKALHRAERMETEFHTLVRNFKMLNKEEIDRFLEVSKNMELFLQGHLYKGKI